MFPSRTALIARKSGLVVAIGKSPVAYTNCDQNRARVLPTRPGTPQKAFSMYRECDFSSEELRWLRPEIAPGVVQNPRTDVLKVRKSSHVFNFCWDWLSICAIYMGVLDRRIRTDEYY